MVSKRKIKEYNVELHDEIYKLRLENDILREKTEHLKNEFTKSFKYAILVDNKACTHFYQNGIEIDNVKSIKFEHGSNYLPEIEVTLS